MKFDDINLNDDKNAPKLDLDFDLGNSTSEKKSGGTFGFGGGWGGGWGSGTGWGFGGLDDKKTEPEDSGWGFSSKKDKDKKKNNTGFDFNFDSLAGEDDPVVNVASAKDETPADDPW